MGLFSGGIYGLVQSTKQTTRALLEIGPNYPLARLAIYELNSNFE